MVLVENDSKDRTVEVFLNWARNLTRNFTGNITGITSRGSGHQRSMRLSAELIQFKVQDRTKKNLQTLAIARNHYLQLLEQPRHAEVDYLIAVDTDMCYPWEVARITKVR
jgi:hypothetical protein